MASRKPNAAPDFEVPDLKIPKREGYARGQRGMANILRAARKLLIEHGASALTLRRIAAECGLKAGNLAYYYRTKEDLIRDLISAIVADYMHSFDAIAHDGDATPEDRLGRIQMVILTDTTTEVKTRVFPELWAMSNQSAFVQECLDRMYRQVREVMGQLIAEMRPDLQPEEIAALALFMSASMEGMILFAGFAKPYRALMPQVQQLAVQSFRTMVKAVAAGELASSPDARSVSAGRRPSCASSARSGALIFEMPELS